VTPEGKPTVDIVSTKASEVTAIVLAAGESARMGTDKALLEFHGETALARMIRVLKEVPVGRIIVVLREHSRALREVDLVGVSSALNIDAARGQTSSIRIGINNLGSPGKLVPGDSAFLLCPVDVPLFQAEDVRALVDKWHGEAGIGEPEPSIVVPSHDGRRGHPVLFDMTLADEFRRLADSDPAHVVLRRDAGRVAHVVRDNPYLVTDLDTPAQYQEALRWLEQNA